MTILIGFGIILLIFLVVAARMMKVKEMEQENQLIQSYMMSMEDFYMGIQNKIEATRRYRHDLAKHIQTLEMLLEKYHQPEGMQEYMDNLKERYSSLKKQEFGCDEIVSSILSIKKEQCEEKQIPLKIQLDDGIYNGIEEVDLVSLLHNLLDNAIEANDRIPEGEEKGVWFTMKKEEGHIILEIKNRFPKGEKISFKTKKTHWEEHGIGTKIIGNLVEKYHGVREYHVQEMDGFFEDRIELAVNV